MSPLQDEGFERHEPRRTLWEGRNDGLFSGESGVFLRAAGAALIGAAGGATLDALRGRNPLRGAFQGALVLGGLVFVAEGLAHTQIINDGHA